MGFKPAKTYSGGNKDFNYPVPEKSGTRPSACSAIVDLGIQKPNPYYEEYDPSNKDHIAKLAAAQEEGGRQSWIEEGYVHPKGKVECIYTEAFETHQVAVFVDLLSDVVDYGEKIGEKQFRLMVNNSFKGDVAGINFNTSYKNSNGDYVLHYNNPLVKMAKAGGVANIADTVDDEIELDNLLGATFMSTIDIKVTEKDGKTYKNVRFKGATDAPPMPDGEPYPMPELEAEPLLITFENATAEKMKLVRKDVIKKIKQASNYNNSNIQKAIMELEGGSADTNEEPEPQKKEPVKKQKKKSEPKPESVEDDSHDYDDDIPF